MENSFDTSATWFADQIRSRKRMLPLFTMVSSHLAQRYDKDINKFIGQHAVDKVYEDEKLVEYAIPPELSSRHRYLTSSFKECAIFTDLLPKMTLVSLVSVFDAYLARLVRALFFVKPDSLNCSNKQLTFAQLSEFDSIETAREYVIECEIESLLRDSHTDQFEWLEKKLGIPLRKDLPAWKKFIEITERRNLIVHADGIASKHYIATCKKEGCLPDPKIKIGDRLNVSPDYYEESCDVIAEIGIKLNQVMWRKLLPEQCQASDDSLIGLSYDLLVKEDYGLAETILRFATKPPIKPCSNESALFMKVNLAIALKGQEKNQECIDYINSTDWSALDQKFKLASMVLCDDYEGASELMKKIGSNGEPGKNEYKSWPLFRWFRKSEEFKSAYHEIFGEEFKIVTHKEESSEVDGDSSSDAE